ncbi:MAG TPA: hypothetical protein VMV31_13640 [Terriglobales bacterium]|nr:hypothetical protein [Terriglobales bacterium]
MKKTLGVATLVAAFGLTMFAFAAPTTVRGYIMDSNCAHGAKVQKMKGNVGCATSCIKRGSAAVLVEDGAAGTVLKIANQDAVKAVIGKHVTLQGNVADGSITVASAKVMPAGMKMGK